MTNSDDRPWTKRPTGRLVQLLVFLFVLNTFVLPQLAGTRDALALIGDLNPLLLAAGAVAEIASLACVSHLIRTLVPAEHRPPSWTVQRIVLAARAASRVVPGGAAAGGVLSYRLLRRVGVPTSDAGFSVTTQSLESAVVLVGIFFVALLVSIPLSGLNAAYLAVTIVGVVLLGAIGALVWAITRGGEAAVERARRIAGRIRILDPDSVEGLLRSVSGRLTELAADRRLLVRRLGWSSAYWLLDAAALWIFLAAFGHWTRVDGLLVAFGLATMLATLPITPGGLGVMEVTLAASLVGFDVPSGIALLGVVSWRLVNYWLPIPVGAAAYLSLRLGRPDRAAVENLEELAEEARVEAAETMPWRSGRRSRVEGQPRGDGEDAAAPQPVVCPGEESSMTKPHQADPYPAGKANYTDSGRLKKSYYERELVRLQEELVKLQYWVQQNGLKVLVIFEGRGSAGKGGVIKRINERTSPRIVRTEALPKPTEREQSEWYFQRYVELLPAGGEIVLFDRSWYNRSNVEWVMGFCNETQHQEFLRSCPEFERMLVRSGIILLKYWFSISYDEQTRRFEARNREPIKRWKLSDMDLEEHRLYVRYSMAKDTTFQYTDIKQAPWYVVPSDDKRRARLNCISHILSMIPYQDVVPDPVVIPEREDIGYVRPPMQEQTFVDLRY